MSGVPVVATAFLLFLSACTTAEPEPPLDPALRLDGRPLVLPLDAYQVSPEDQLVVARARTELFRGCMARSGFTVPVRDAAPAVPLNHERYLLEDENAAQTRGYHPSEAQQAISGPPTRHPGAGDCEEEAVTGLAPTKDAAAAMRLVDDLKSRSWEQSVRDSRVAAVFAAWSSCMAGFGHHYPNPRAANNDTAFQTEEPTPREITTAVSDVRCKRQTKVVDTWALVEAAYQKRAIFENRAELEEGRSAIASLVSAARTVVSAK
ncbi:hypothetical protein [Herbidospora sp. NBRC 101105]|uniref:hypothetical protein n=1 Tax=Herbidospora sp. NBRC 101105 TaxID=3032195 RepID=UPI00255431FD|nr:hypothetical protein [Herbidospora sp. NBRC 101105]